MAVTAFQARVLRLLAQSRVAGGETYIAGGLALNHQLRRPRISHDIDVFNNTYEAMLAAADADRSVLRAAGLNVVVKRERDFIVEVTVSDGCETTDIQWVQDSAYRFFPLVEDELLGVTLHPFDLATNKLLALAGRRVPRDWVDTISCSQSLQPLGFLAWAANGKDLGLSPRYILEMAARTRYVQSELDMAVVSDEPLDVAMLSRTWHEMIEAARQTIAILPPDQAGKAVLNKDGSLFTGSDAELSSALAVGEVVFHEGRICGAWPQIVG